MLVREIMNRPVFTVRATDTLREAWELMRDRRIRHLPVVDESGRLVGIVTDRDLRGASPSKL
ncbi:MAG TPA: CBS domain-containing protein, partial [Bacillaceae bacterium]|nr:CBS domain-containing protein [Bacillaceae bacterium]